MPIECGTFKALKTHATQYTNEHIKYKNKYFAQHFYSLYDKFSNIAVCTGVTQGTS